MSEHCWVYRLWNGDPDGPDSELLYVGISDSPSSRMGNHESQKWWWWMVDNVSWQRFETRSLAKRSETEAITNEYPLFNVDESTWNNWQRLEYVVKLAWRLVTTDDRYPYWFTCPFCESEGITSVPDFVEPPRIFIRRHDDRLVLHVPVTCCNHSEQIIWAEQRPVGMLLARANCRNEKDAQELMSKAVMDAGPTAFDSVGSHRHKTLNEILEMSVGVMRSLQEHQPDHIPALTHSEVATEQ